MNCARDLRCLQYCRAGDARGDGLGTIGEHVHSNREYMLKDSLLERCRLPAASILEFDKLNFQELKNKMQSIDSGLL